MFHVKGKEKNKTKQRTIDMFSKNHKVKLTQAGKALSYILGNWACWNAIM